jgi:hypothetical protein
MHGFLTLALVGDEWSASRPGKSPHYPLDRRLGRPQSQSGRYGEMKIRDSNSDPSVVLPISRHYTDCTALVVSLRSTIFAQLTMLVT